MYRFKAFYDSISAISERLSTLSHVLKYRSQKDLLSNTNTSVLAFAVYSRAERHNFTKNHIILLKFIPKHTILRLHLNTLFKEKSSFNFTRTELNLLTEKPIDRNIIEKKYISFFVLEQLSKALKQTKSPLGAAWSISFERRTSVNQQLYQLSNMVLKVIHETNIMYILHTEIILYRLLVIVISREAQKSNTKCRPFTFRKHTFTHTQPLIQTYTHLHMVAVKQ